MVTWAGLFGSGFHMFALKHFLLALEDAMECGWLAAPNTVRCVYGPDEDEK